MIGRVVNGMTYFAKGFWTDRHLSQWVTTIMIMVDIGLGTAIFAGGDQRFNGLGFGPLRTFTNDQMWVYAVWICIAAMLMSVPFRWVNVVGLWLSTAWFILWMTCFTIASIHYPSVAATGIPMYGGMAMISAALLTARVIENGG